MIRFVCECGRQLQAREDDVGKKAKCPSCDAVMNVPREGGPRRERRRRRDDLDDRPSRRDDDYDDYDDDRGPDRVGGAAGKTSGQATASMVLGLISLCLPVLPALPGLILGILALRNSAGSRGRLGGRGLAIGGIVTSCLSFIMLAPFVIVLGMLLPAVSKVSEAAARLQDQNNLKQLAGAFHSFSDVNGRLPQAAAFRTRAGQPGLSWRVALLPYLGQDKLYRRFRLDEAWDSPNNQPLLAEMPPVFLMPDQTNDGTGQTFYQVFVGPGTLFDEPKPVPRPGPDGVRLGLRFVEVTDGTANTLMVTAGRSSVPWTKPDDLPFEPNGLLPPLSDRVPGGFNVLFGDGSVRYLPHRTTPEQTIKALITRNGGEVVNLP
jgi:prepilin-type processing-associated H-X9-DG protein